MPAKDVFHDCVRNALIKDGWTITDDPLKLKWGKSKLYVDLAAEKLLIAEKSGRQIVEHGVKPEVLLRGETIVERLILEYQANAAPDFVGFCCYVIARYTRFTGRRSQ